MCNLFAGTSPANFSSFPFPVGKIWGDRKPNLCRAQDNLGILSQCVIMNHGFFFCEAIRN